jgi:hypothetical protein
MQREKICYISVSFFFLGKKIAKKARIRREWGSSTSQTPRRTRQGRRIAREISPDRVNPIKK